MSVTDPIQIGRLKLTPHGFHGKEVAVLVEAVEDIVDDEAIVRQVRDMRDKDLNPANGDQVLAAVPVLPIPVWESLQTAAWQLDQMNRSGR